MKKNHLCIKKAIAALESQNKMIRIADKSLSGSEMVEDYLSESVASSSCNFRKHKATELRTSMKK